MTERSATNGCPGRAGRLADVLTQLAESATDPVHRRLIKAYAGPTPLEAMVAEFAKVLGEVARGEA
jgi:hypothetical protein